MPFPQRAGALRVGMAAGALLSRGARHLFTAAGAPPPAALAALAFALARAQGCHSLRPFPQRAGALRVGMAAGAPYFLVGPDTLHCGWGPTPSRSLALAFAPARAQGCHSLRPFRTRGRRGWASPQALYFLGARHSSLRLGPHPQPLSPSLFALARLRLPLCSMPADAPRRVTGRMPQALTFSWGPTFFTAAAAAPAPALASPSLRLGLRAVTRGFRNAQRVR